MESFLAQKTDFRYEVIVHDDASADNSAEIIREFAGKYPEIIKPIFQTENCYIRGKNPTVEYMLPKVSGEYIAFCEGDDYWTSPQKLCMQTEWLDAHRDYSACVHNTSMLIGETGKFADYNTKYTEDRDIAFGDVVYGVGGVFHYSSILLRSELMKELPEFYLESFRHHVGDHPTAILCAMNGKIRYFNEKMSVYRVNSTPFSWTSKMLDNRYVVNRLKGAVGMYEALLPAVSGEQAALTEKAFLNYQWELYQAEGKYAEMKKPPLDKIHRQKSFKQRVWVDFKQFFPGIFCAYMKLTGKEAGLPQKFIREK